MTKQFSLSALVAALSTAAATVPMVAWLTFDTPGRQGVSALPALVPTLLIAWPLARSLATRNRLGQIAWSVTMALWQLVLWITCLSPTPSQTLVGAFARVFSEWLYAAPPVLLIGMAGAIATLGLMMSVSPVRGPQD